MTNDCYNFCTLFDRGFLVRGLALYESLMKQCQHFTLWIMCNDAESYDMLSKLALPNIKLLRMKDVEDQAMLAVKPSRSIAEYCWMFSSALPLYLLEKHPEMKMITYLDADLYFYSSLEPIYDEFGSSSILIIPHGYSDRHKQSQSRSGIYNVGMLIFRNDPYALECLRWWKERVIEWCFAYYEDGKLGDQMYLDDWPTRFKHVHVLNNPGANVASWNVDRFSFRQSKNGNILGRERISGIIFPLVFFHFHGLKIYLDKSGRAHFYPATIFEKYAYKIYLEAIRRAYSTVRSQNPAWNFGAAKKLDILRVIKQNIALFLKQLK